MNIKWLSLTTLIISFVSHLWAAELKISVASLDQDRHPTLVLSGAGTGRYAVEASTNLLEWFQVYSGTPDNGSLSYVHLGSVAYSGLYYRGVESSETNAPDLVMEVDPHTAAAGLITFEKGGQLTLTNSGGVRYTFTVAPSNVTDSVAISMRLITNFTKFPADNAMRTAVLFEPDGYTFYGGGLLEIQFPTNVPHLKLASFGFDATGSGFHFKPDLVSSNRVRIPITHFSGAGAALWEPNQFSEAATRQIDRSIDRAGHEFAIELEKSRQREAAGEAPDPNLMSHFTDALEKIYNNEIVPQFAAAQKNCALAIQLWQRSLGLERQRQLLGAAGGKQLLPVDEFESWECNCIKEAIEACKNGKISSSTLTRTLLGAERQSQLLGYGEGVLQKCGLSGGKDLLKAVSDLSLPCQQEWAGEIRYSDSGSRTVAGCDPSDEALGAYGCFAFDSLKTELYAYVDLVELVEDAGETQRWRLKLIGEIKVTNERASTVSYHGEKGCNVHEIISGQAHGSENMLLEMNLVTTAGEVVELTMETDFLTRPGIKYKGSTTNSGECPPTGTDEKGESFSNTEPVLFDEYYDPIFVDFTDYTFTQKGPTEIQATSTGTKEQISHIQSSYNWNIHLFRRPPAQ